MKRSEYELENDEGIADEIQHAFDDKPVGVELKIFFHILIF